MMDKTQRDFNLINHCLFKNMLVLFLLPHELRREQFAQCIETLASRGHRRPTPEELDNYWEAFRLRMRGESRWDKVSPPIVPESTDDWRRRKHLSENTVENIPQKRTYLLFSISGIKYVLDVWNPRNELGVDYPGAGEPVLALVLAEEAYGNVQDRLAENTDFYDIIRGIGSICEARKIIGMNSGNLSSLMRAYIEKSIDMSSDPWSFLFPLQVLQVHKHVGYVALKRYFMKVEDWGDGRLLLQVKTGIDYTINRQNADAAKLLGVTAVQDLNPDVMREKKADA